MTSIPELRLKAAERLEIRGFSGSLADLTPDERERVIDQMAIIVNESPEDFDGPAREFARKRIASPFFQKPFDKFTIADGLKTFGTEFANQARQVATLQLGTLKTALFLAAIAAGIVLARKAK